MQYKPVNSSSYHCRLLLLKNAMVLVLYCVAPVNAMKEGEDWVQGGGRKMRGGGERREDSGEGGEGRALLYGWCWG